MAALFGSKISDDFMVMGMYYDRYQEYVKICKEYIGYIKEISRKFIMSVWNNFRIFH